MEKMKVYKCEMCQTLFENERDCQQHERMHFLKDCIGAIHIFDTSLEPLRILDCNLDDIYFISCDTKEAAEAFRVLFKSEGLHVPCAVSAYQPGIWAFNEDNEFGPGYGWTHLPTLYENLGALIEELQEKEKEF